MNDRSVEREVIKVNGHSREIITVRDNKGKIVHKTISHLMAEFHFKDMLQVIIGATILAIPVAFTEETWKLGENLPLFNILGFLLLAILFIGFFVYYNYYREGLKEHKIEFAKRVLATYLFSFIVVAIIMSLIQKAPWTVDGLLAFKRVVLVTLPASMSAAVADVIK